MPLNKEQEKVMKVLTPIIKKLMREVEKLDNIQVSGFIFSFDESVFMHFNNLDETHFDSPNLHAILAEVSGRLQKMGHFKSADLGEEKLVQPETLADKIATDISMMPNDMVPEDLRNLASEYIRARREKKE